MAQSIFKNMTPAERVEARRQARLNKKSGTTVAAPRLTFAETNRGKSASAAEREETYAAKPRGYQPTPEQEAARAAAGNKNFEDIFLSVIQFLPPDQQGRAFSLFGVFRQQKPEDQKAIVDSLMKVAQEQTGPLFDLYKQRIEQDTEYSKAALNRQLTNAKHNYERLVQTVDTNALRDKAKTDRNMAKVIRQITNTAFVDRVAGSGIQRRRTQEQIDEARLTKEDIQIGANQTKGAAGQQFGQIEQDIKAKIEREDVLGGRDVFDNEEKQKEAERSLFLSLFENQFASAGDNARDNIESGDIDPTTGKPGSNVTINPGGVNDAGIRASETYRSDVFQSGGTDAQRKTRGAEEARVANAKAEDARIKSVLSSADEAVSMMFSLNNYRAALKLANRDTSAIDAEIARLKPIAQIQIDRARSGQGSFRGNSGSGIPSDVQWYLDKAADGFIFDSAKLVGRYGTSPLDRAKLTEILQSYSSEYPDQQFGAKYTDLYKDFSSINYNFSNGQPINPYGEIGFDESKRGPVPVPISSQMNPRADVLSTATVAPSSARSPVPLQAGWTDGLTNNQAVSVLGDLRAGRAPAEPAPQASVINPNTGKAYTGAAAKRLSTRLAR